MPSRPITRCAAALMASFVALSGAGLAGISQAAEAGQPQVQLSPDASTDANNSYYVLSASPGQQVAQKVAITNPTTHDLDVVLRGVDGLTASHTGAAYSEVGEPVTATGTWISISTPGITLSPGEHREVTFTVIVPTGVRAGQHLGGLAVYSPVPPPAPSGGKVQMQITVQPQRVIAVEVDVPGPAAPKLSVNGVVPRAGSDGIDLAIAISNDGDAFARGRGHISVASTGLATDFDIDTFVPGTKIALPIAWTRNVASGSHAVEVTLSYDDGRTTSWTGTIDVAGTAKANLERDLADQRALAGALPAASASTGSAQDSGSSGAAVGTLAVWAGAAVVLGLLAWPVSNRLRRPPRSRTAH